MAANTNIIAIDGPSASGKGTLARKLAGHLNYAHLETGLLYRGVGWLLLSQNLDPDDSSIALQAAQDLQQYLLRDVSFLQNPALRGNDVADYTSRSSLHPAVREALFQLQIDFSARPPGAKNGAILDGRDIGTVVCPDAPVKFYVTASPEVRAERRLNELQKLGIAATYASVLAEVKERDERDQNRPVAPLRPAQDAIHLDTSMLYADQAFAAALQIVEQKLAF